MRGYALKRARRRQLRLNDSMVRKLIRDNQRLGFRIRLYRDAINIKDLIVNAMKKILDFAVQVKDKAAQVALKRLGGLLDKVKQSPAKIKDFMRELGQVAKYVPGYLFNRLVAIAQVLKNRIVAHFKAKKQGEAAASNEPINRGSAFGTSTMQGPNFQT